MWVHWQIYFSRAVIIVYISFFILFGLIFLEAIPILLCETFSTLQPRIGQLSVQRSLSHSIWFLGPAHLSLYLQRGRRWWAVKDPKLITELHEIREWGGMKMFQGTQQQSSTIRTEAFFFPGFGGCAIPAKWQLPGAQLRWSVEQTFTCTKQPKQFSSFAQ